MQTWQNESINSVHEYHSNKTIDVGRYLYHAASTKLLEVHLIVLLIHLLPWLPWYWYCIIQISLTLLLWYLCHMIQMSLGLLPWYSCCIIQISMIAMIPILHDIDIDDCYDIPMMHDTDIDDCCNSCCIIHIWYKYQVEID